MTIDDMNEKELGAHHCTRENISFTVGWLKSIESGERSPADQDWRAECGVLALQFKWLLSQLDSG